ncbi:branched-chain amino acid transport system II carrier protein [Lysinibacillus xylanilyticus]|uniref:branched-chain amino acid transport system II carrier protein n=1 Tax=Lysinibacillus xylanilyticus TaxID=582475 RepID=UPI00381027C1
MFVFSLLGVVFTNFLLKKILSMASPVLMFLYPIAITLIILIFTEKWFGGAHSVYVGTMIGTALIAILDALKDANIMVEQINYTFGFIPLFISGAGWIITGLLGAIIGYIFSNKSVVQSSKSVSN